MLVDTRSPHLLLFIKQPGQVKIFLYQKQIFWGATPPPIGFFSEFDRFHKEKQIIVFSLEAGIENIKNTTKRFFHTGLLLVYIYVWQRFILPIPPTFQMVKNYFLR